MKNKEGQAAGIARYLADIGADETSINRIDEVIRLYSRITGSQPMKDLFVSDSIGENGARILNSLWLFYSDFICEAKNFLSATDFDLSRVSSESIVYWQLQSVGFDFENPQEGSKIAFRVDFSNRVNCVLYATGRNCAYFMEIFRKYFAPSPGRGSLV